MASYHHPVREPNKLRKKIPLPPPSSFSFIPDEPPPVHNFPYNFEPPSRPVTVLSFSQEPMHQRKLTKPRRSVPNLSLPPPTPPKRRQSLTLNFTQTIKRRLSTKKEKTLDPEPEPLTIPLSLPSKPKIFTLEHEPDYPTRPRPTLPFTISHGSNSGSASTESAGSSSKRRWTLAMAMTNQDLSDEVFVADVERIRQTVSHDHGWNWEWGLPDDPDTEYFIESPTSSEDGFNYNSHFGPSVPNLQRRNSDYNHTFASVSTRTYRAPTDPGHGPPDKAWSSALRALLITRDLLRTERNYLASLKILLDSSPCNAIMTPGEFGFLSNNVMGRSGSQLLYPLAHVAPPPSDYLSASSSKPHLPWPSRPPPPLMHTYISALIAVSTIFVRRLEADPTIEGAARAFIGCSADSYEWLVEDEEIESLERVYVGWCGVVGGWFAEEETKEKEKRRKRKLSKTKSMRLNTDLSPHQGPDSPLPVPKSASEVEGRFEKARDPKEWRSSSAISLFKRHTTHSNSSAKSHTFPPPESDLDSSTSSTLNLSKLADRRSSLSMAKSKWRKSMPSVPSLSYSSTPFPPRPSSTFFRPPSPTPPPVPPKPANLNRTLQMSMSPIHQSNVGTPTTPVSPTTIYTSPSASTSVSTCTPIPTTPTPTHGSPQAIAMGSRRKAFERDREERVVSERVESALSTRLPMGRGRGRDEEEKDLGLSVSSHYHVTSEVSSNGNIANGAASEAPMINGRRVHSVRELAILPVQRVTRYVLLYRDILRHTPSTSSSRTLLERAADTANRIAQKCDRAQENSKFLWSPAPGRDAR